MSMDFVGGLMARMANLETVVDRQSGLAVPTRIARARAYHNAAQSIANNTTTTLSFNTTRIGSAGIHDPVNSILVATAPGWWHGGVHVEWQASASGERHVWVNHVLAGIGTTTTIAYATQSAAGTALVTIQSFPFGWEAGANDYFFVNVYQNSGVALNVVSAAAQSPEFWVELAG
jgi:hypothetical protein